MTKTKMDNDLISRRRIRYELGESTMPKRYREFCLRVIDSERLTPTAKIDRRFTDMEFDRYTREKLKRILKDLDFETTGYEWGTEEFEFLMDLCGDIEDALKGRRQEE